MRLSCRSLHLAYPAALVLLLAACSGDSSGPDDDGGNNGGGGNEVVIRLTAGNAFSPNDVTVDPGTTVRWVNDAAVLHTVTPADPNQQGAWQSAQTNAPGTVLSHVFNTPGRTYNYFCQPHQAAGMTGVVRVR